MMECLISPLTYVLIRGPHSISMEPEQEAGAYAQTISSNQGLTSAELLHGPIKVSSTDQIMTYYMRLRNTGGQAAFRPCADRFHLTVMTHTHKHSHTYIYPHIHTLHMQ